MVSPPTLIASVASDNTQRQSPETSSADEIQGTLQEAFTSGEVRGTIQEASAIDKGQYPGRAVFTAEPVSTTEKVEHTVEGAIAEKAVDSFSGQDVQHIAGKIISQDTADIIDEILHENEDITQGTSTPGELDDTPQRTTPMISSEGLPSVDAAAYMSNTRGRQSPPLAGNSINYTIENEVFKLLPTMEQWQDFPGLLQYAESLGVEESGAFKVLVPEGVAGRNLSGPQITTTQKGNRFLVERLDNSTFKLERKESDISIQAELRPTDTSSAEQLIQRFETLLTDQAGGVLEDVYYCADIDAKEPSSRATFGFPRESPIWPLKGDRLAETKKRIPGLHWPFSYHAGPAF